MDLLQMVMLGLNVFLAFCNACIMVYVFVKFLSKPHDTLDERIIELEVWKKETEKALHQGNDRFREQDETNEVLIHSVLALIEFEIQYCLIEHKDMSKDLEQAKHDLHSYLSRR